MFAGLGLDRAAHVGLLALRHVITPGLDDAVRAVLDRISRGFRNGESFSELVSKLVYGGDEYMLLADFDSYVNAHERLYSLMSDSAARSRASLCNIACSGVFAVPPFPLAPP